MGAAHTVMVSVVHVTHPDAPVGVGLRGGELGQGRGSLLLPQLGRATGQKVLRIKFGGWEPPDERNGETVGLQALPTWLQGLVSQGPAPGNRPDARPASYPATGLFPSKPSSSFS